MQQTPKTFPEAHDFHREEVDSLRIERSLLSDAYFQLRNTTQKLEESEERYRRIIETANEGIWVIDDKQITTFVNPRTAALFGFSQEEMLGQKFIDFIAPDELNDHLHEMENRRQGKPGYYERRFKRKNDGVVWCHVSATPIIDKSNQFLGSFAMLTDITDRKKLENHNKEVDELKTKFIQIVSHQLRTPLTAIRWNIEMLLKNVQGKISNEQCALLNDSHEASIKILSSVGDLLEVMNIEENKLRPVFEDLDVTKFFQQVCESRLSDLAGKQIVYRIVPPKESLPPIRIDRQKIQSVIERLIDNAIVYTPTNGSIDIRYFHRDGVIRFEISDTGIGIPVTEQHHIFEKFFRGQKAPLYQPNAFGISLFISKRYIEIHRGTIGFFSTIDNGSVFWFELPIDSH